MRKFSFEQEHLTGWVFAKDAVNNDIFVFGPDLKDVMSQADEAEALLEHARQRLPAVNAVWKHLEVA